MYEFYSLLGTHAALRNFPKIGQAVAHEILVLQSKAGMIPKLSEYSSERFTMDNFRVWQFRGLDIVLPRMIHLHVCM